MKRIVFLATVICMLLISSCKKCKECFMDETNSFTNTTTTRSLGKKCGNEMEELDGKTYVGPDGPVKTYCQ